MLDELYPEAADVALKARASRPVEPAPEPSKFSSWGAVKAAAGGFPAGAAQAGASAIEVMGGLSRVDISPDAMAAKTPEELGRIQEAAQKTLEEGFRGNDVSRSLRSVRDYYRPDPATTHAAEQVIFDLTRMGSKAVAAAVMLGNVPGAVAAGLEEGFSQSEDLAAQGVDVATRSKVGAVTAATNAVSFALPVAGKTWQQTVGLALAGGPVGFMAQNAATRKILADADYSKLAEQYDPLDPVGLALSTVIPLGFGALAMRGARGVKSADGAPVKEGAPVERVVDTPKAPDDVVDAARVALLRENVDRTNPAPDSIPAQDAHVRAYDQAIDQMSAGERVRVDVPEAVAVKATEAMAPRIEEFTAAVRESGLMPAARAVDGMADAGRAVDAPAGAVEARPAEAAARPVDQPITPESIAADVRKIIENDPLKPKTEGAAPAEPSPMQRAAERVMQEQPNMVIRLEGDEVSRPVAEVMAEMKAVHDADVQDAGLLQVAAECFIETLGAAM